MRHPCSSPWTAWSKHKHALIQDTAYQLLLRSSRQQVHQQVAQALTEQFAETVSTQPELVAHHCMEAGLHERSVHYWHQAGERSQTQSAHGEAIQHFTKGLALLKTLPKALERAQQELSLCIPLAMSFGAIKGHGGPDVEQMYSRAQALCEQVNSPSQFLRLLQGQWSRYFLRAEYQAARETAEHLHRLAQHRRDLSFRMWGHCAIGSICRSQGEFVTARHHLEQSMACYDPEQHRSPTSTVVTHPAVLYLTALIKALWPLGYPDQVQVRAHEMLTLAQALSHPYSIVQTRTSATILHQFYR